MRPKSAATRNDDALKLKSRRMMAQTNDPIEKLRHLCLSRGANGILSFGKMFRRMDDDSSQTLNEAEFYKGVTESGLLTSPEESKRIFEAFDKNHSGSIDFEEFIRALRPPMNGNRKKLVEMAFEKLDTSGDGIVGVEDLRGVYSVARHPNYISGEQSEDEILRSYIRKFEGNTTVDGKITREEFFDYYSGVSASIDQDGYFDLMMRNSWGI